MTECPNARRYKGLIPPKCNGGKPCQACKDKYNQNVREFNKWLESLDLEFAKRKLL